MKLTTLCLSLTLLGSLAAAGRAAEKPLVLDLWPGKSPENSVQMYLAPRGPAPPAGLHVPAAGGHGFGMRRGKLPTAEWPKRCEEWMRSRGLLGPAVQK